MKWNDPVRDSRLKLEDEARRRKQAVSGPEPRKSWRESAYGGLHKKVSVRTMDIVIGAIVALIIIALIVGIATRQ